MMKFITYFLLIIVPITLVCYLDAHASGFEQSDILSQSVQMHQVNGKLNLNDLIAAAQESHPLVYEKMAATETADAYVDGAYQNFFPKPYVELNESRLHGQDNVSSESRMTVLGVEQPLWTGGKLTAALASAKSTLESSKHSVSEARLQISLRVIENYRDFMMYEGRVLAQQEGLRILTGLAEKIDRRVASGVSAQVDRDLVQTRISQILSDLYSSKIKVQTAIFNLNQLVGHNLTSADLEFPEKVLVVEPRALDDLVGRTLAESPALKRLSAELETLSHNADQIKSALFPTFSLKAEYMTDDLGASDSNEVTQVSGVLSFSPGSGLSTFTSLQAAQSRIKMHKNSVDAVKKDLQTQVQLFYDDCMSSYLRYDLVTSSIENNKSIFESYGRLFVTGKRSWLDVINAARDYTQSKIDMSYLLSSYYGSLYKIKMFTAEIDFENKGLN